jgi:hypothetical protein
VGLLIPRTQRLAGWGLVALLIAVFPANVNVAVHNLQIPGLPGAAVYQWARLPLQLVLIGLLVWATRQDTAAPARQEPVASPPAGQDRPGAAAATTATAVAGPVIALDRRGHPAEGGRGLVGTGAAAPQHAGGPGASGG